MTVARRLAEGEYYHVMHRGVHRQNICRDHADWRRLLFYILFLQSPRSFKNTARIVKGYSPLTGYPVDEQALSTPREVRDVELVSFALMPNHFHLLLKQVTSTGISRFLQRISTAYTMYFNTRYESSGHLFQGRYKSVLVKDNRQLLYLSAYIHRNPRELKGWRGKEFEYPWSSLQDYASANRWGGLLSTDIIAGQFGATKDSNYADFVRTSSAKTLAGEIDPAD